MFGNVTATEVLKPTVHLYFLWNVVELCSVEVYFSSVGTNTADQRHSAESVAAP